MEAIQERDYIDDFLSSIGIEERSYTVEELDNIIGKESNPFLDNVEYSDIYNYISSINHNKNVIMNQHLTNLKLKDDELRYSYTRIAIVMFSIILWIIYFLAIPGTIIFKCAKGFGLNLRIWSMISIFLMCRTLLMGKVEKHTSYHILIGYILTFCAFGHTTFHLINNRTRDDLQYITGYILLFLSVIIAISSYFRHNAYNIFSNIHRLTYLWLPLCIIHVIPIWQWFTVPLIMIGIETFVNFVYKLQISKLTNSKISKTGKMIFLSVPRQHSTVSGSYYRILVPSINLEWHSFSVANSELVDQLLFLIEARGDWTRALYDKISAGSNSYVLIMGPFYTSSTEIMSTESEKKICIAGGIGIAPFISVIDTKVQISKCNRAYRENYLLMFGHKLQQKKSLSLSSIIEMDFSAPNRHPLKIIWIFRDPLTVHHLFDYIKYIMMESTNVYLDIYITGNFKGDDRVKKIFHVLRLLDGASTHINIFFERPALVSIINNETPAPDTVFFCGSDRMENEIKCICKKANITLKCEKFD